MATQSSLDTVARLARLGTDVKNLFSDMEFFCKTNYEEAHLPSTRTTTGEVVQVSAILDEGELTAKFSVTKPDPDFNFLGRTYTTTESAETWRVEGFGVNEAELDNLAVSGYLEMLMGRQPGSVSGAPTDREAMARIIEAIRGVGSSNYQVVRSFGTVDETMVDEDEIGLADDVNIGHVIRAGDEFYYITAPLCCTISDPTMVLVRHGLSVREDELEGTAQFLTITTGIEFHASGNLRITAFFIDEHNLSIEIELQDPEVALDILEPALTRFRAEKLGL